MTIAAPRRAIQSAEAGIQGWIDRVSALTGLGTGVAAILLATGQFGYLNRVWLLAIAGSLLASSILLPIYAWSHRGVRVPVTLFAVSVAVGLWTWPLAIIAPEPATDHAPWLWPCIGVSTVIVSIAWGVRAALLHNVLCSVAYLIARLRHFDDQVSLVTAVQDTLIVGVQPVLVLLTFAYVRRQAVTLDSWIATVRRRQADASLRATLLEERDRLDAVIHDEVMTALVAAARSAGRHHPHVTELAQRAIDALRSQGRAPEAGDSFHPVNVVRLLRDVAASVNPGIAFDETVDPNAGRIPEPVVQAIAQAVREGVLNAEKHAGADEMSLSVSISGRPGAVRLPVVVADDGVGFDPSAVPERRLGIRLSLMRRVSAVGGIATVHSAPGHGTRVEILWEGAGDVSGAAHLTASRAAESPAFGRVDLGPLALMAGAGATLFTVVMLLQSLASPRPELVWASFGLLFVAVPLCMVRFGQRMSAGRTVVVSVICILVCYLNLAAVPAGSWPLHTSAFIGVICVVVVLVRANSRPFAAWAVAMVAGGMVWGASLMSGNPAALELGAALSPLAWLVPCEMLIVWMRRVQRELDLAQQAADVASSESSASFARLVVREVWVAEIEDAVGDVLARLTDPHVEITPLLREACLAAEGGLRDRIKAANFVAPALSAAIMHARLRGVEVTLVDNRGAQLEEHVRRIETRHLQRMVEATRSGRIVARTAPAGYGEAVTIVQTGGDGSAMTRIDDDGTIVVVQT